VAGKHSIGGSDATLTGTFSDWLGFVPGKHFIGGSDTYTEVNFSDWLRLWRENILLVDQMRHSQGPSLIGWGLCRESILLVDQMRHSPQSTAATRAAPRPEPSVDSIRSN
jgi:hypothetical protein